MPLTIIFEFKVATLRIIIQLIQFFSLMLFFQFVYNYSKTSSPRALSLENFFGLSNNCTKSYFFTDFLIVGQSVETKIYLLNLFLPIWDIRIFFFQKLFYIFVWKTFTPFLPIIKAHIILYTYRFLVC